MLASAAMSGCGGSTAATNADMGASPDLAMAANPCTSGVICTKSTIADQSINLNDTSQAMFSVLAAPGYSGMVNVTVVRTAVDALSGGKAPDVNIAVVPGVFQLTAGTPVSVTVNFTTTTAAAAFTAQTVTLHVADATDSTKEFDVPVKLTVNPVLNINFQGDGVNVKHTWSTDNGNTVNFNVRQRAVTGTGANTTGGTTFNFNNKDTNDHIIHGDGKITHQSTNGTGTPPNGTYTVANVNDVMNAGTDGFYCHTHGTGGSTPGVGRFITFIP
jgi:hypothetical protein